MITRLQPHYHANKACGISDKLLIDIKSNLSYLSQPFSRAAKKGSVLMTTKGHSLFTPLRQSCDPQLGIPRWKPHVVHLHLRIEDQLRD